MVALFFQKRPADLKPRILVVLGCIFKVEKIREKKTFFFVEKFHSEKKSSAVLGKSFGNPLVNFLTFTKGFSPKCRGFFFKVKFLHEKKSFFFSDFFDLKNTSKNYKNPGF